MRVVLATHKTNQWLGVNKYFYLLGKYLAQLGIDVRIIVDSPEGAKAVSEILGGSEYGLPPTATNPVFTLHYCYNIKRHLENLDFDILHCGHILPFFYLMKKQRKHVVFQPFGNELFTLSGRGMNPLYCKLAQPFLRYCGEHADVLLAEGRFQLGEMIGDEYFGLKGYYPNARRVEILPVGVESPPMRKQNYSTDKQFQFLAVNSLLPYEGMDELIYAFRVVNSHSKLVIVGTGSEEDKLKRQAEGLNVEFQKNIPEHDLRALYVESDAFVSPTYETDFQMGVLEAMVVGLPVISRSAKWLPDSVIKFQGVMSMREKLQWITSASAPSRAERAQKGLEWVQQYSFTNIAEKAVKIYEELLCNNFTQVIR